jgi:hypothetical protein
VKEEEDCLTIMPREVRDRHVGRGRWVKRESNGFLVGPGRMVEPVPERTEPHPVGRGRREHRAVAAPMAIPTFGRVADPMDRPARMWTLSRDPVRLVALCDLMGSLRS